MTATISEDFRSEKTQFELEGRDLGYSYFNSKMVYDHVNLRTYENELVAIVGPSGCGKSTLIRQWRQQATILTTELSHRKQQK
ncbi:MAG TPA: ATP-binding cassette domain-containing protein [Candidatus Acidoferrales bacterium]|nr:ATP-binding cassette domain-containing protein [Candidatus Acidoferrales bacterium]